jgi:hypothetical protein
VSDTDGRLLRLGEGDNILIARVAIPAGTPLRIGGVTVETDADLGVGFKVAASDLDQDMIVLRIGVPIGKTTHPIRRGALVHTHNLASQYLRTHARGEA